MAIRLTGLNSGMDTEAIVSALMSVQSLKKTKVEKAKTKLEWKQTAWADLNTKLTNLYNNYVTKMQLQSSYQAKKATVSDTSKVNVTAGNSAANGSYVMEVKNIATSQYLTSAKINADSTKTKLVDIDPSLLNKEIEVTYNGTTSKYTVTADSTISDFTKALTNAGLNASYDSTQKRFFISSKESGLSNAFSITASALSEAELNGRQALYDAVGYTNMTSENRAVVDSAMAALQTAQVDSDEYNTALDSLAKAAYETKKNMADTVATTYVKARLYSENYESKLEEAKQSLKSEYFDEDGNLLEGKTQEEYESAAAAKADTDTAAYVNEQITSEENTLAVKEAAFAGKTVADIEALGETAVNKYYAAGVNGFDGLGSADQDSVKADIETVVRDYAGISDRNTSLADSALSSLGLADIVVDADGNVSVNGGANDANNTSIPSGMALIAASDSKIILNGAEMTSSSSTVSVNGLTIELTGTTKADETITFSVSNDVDGVYNSIKEFLKEYNSVMLEMYTLYNAESAKDYEPLTSEQKEAMTDDEIELWEDKIKKSLLRSDSTLSSIMQSMRSAMMTSVTVDGKRYSLASFGIMTSTNYTEGGQLHIYGDADDATYSSQDDKLKVALANDPETVTKVLSEIFTNLRTTMSQKMSSVKGYKSSLSFYNDLKIKSDISDYEDEIEKWEDKLADLEDSYYSKFTAMETALAKLQSQQTSLSSLFGG